MSVLRLDLPFSSPGGAISDEVETVETPEPLTPAGDAESYLLATRTWLEEAVIGLNLCPFARAVYVRDQVRLVVSSAIDEVALMADLEAELNRLREIPAERIDTTVLIHPHVLRSFEEYTAFLVIADGILAGMRLRGVIQIASFHPDYVFAGTEANDVTNCTNRSPYPILHLLREESLERAIASHPDTARIYEANRATMRRLGHTGWQALRKSGSSARDPTDPPAIDNG